MSGLYPAKPWENEEAAMFRQTVRRFLAAEAVPHDERWRQQRGFMNEYAIARMYADVRVQRIYGGANEIMKELIARTLA
jgi:alkylation response protein AidB-like acyl-CoA dehydrogenase